MVQLKKNSIVITIENVDPLEDWQDLMLTMADVTKILMSNADFKVSEYNMNMFTELHKASCTLSNDSSTIEVLAKHIASSKSNAKAVSSFEKTLADLDDTLAQNESQSQKI